VQTTIVSLVVISGDRYHKDRVRFAVYNFGGSLALPHTVPYANENSLSTAKQLFTEITGDNPNFVHIKKINFFEIDNTLYLVYACILPQVVQAKDGVTAWLSMTELFSKGLKSEYFNIIEETIGVI
jgi:hypothetical protein